MSSTPDAKPFLTQQARAALAGVTVYQVATDDGRPEYIATRWAMTKAFDSLDELAKWLDRVAPRTFDAG